MSTTADRLAAALADRYRIERELGQGGMATVYLARDIRHDRDVAIKVLHEDLGATLGPERFLAEIKTTAKLQHPHILPLLDSGAGQVAGGPLRHGRRVCRCPREHGNHRRADERASAGRGEASLLAWDSAGARRAVQGVITAMGDTSLSSFEVARAYMQLGEREKAITTLERAAGTFAWPTPSRERTLAARLWAPVARDPRFLRAVDRLPRER